MTKMKSLKPVRYVTFCGNEWSDEGSHRRSLTVSKKLESTVFAKYIESLELAKPDENGGYNHHTYYKCDGVMVTDEEYELLRKIGVKDLTIKGVYADQNTPVFKTIFVVGMLTAISWNLLLMLKFVGVI